MACYSNRNDLTYFSISEGLKHQVVFSYLDDVESNFLKIYKTSIENDSIIRINNSVDKRLDKFITERISFYKENPNYNKFDNLLNQLNKSVDIIKDNESIIIYDQ